LFVAKDLTGLLGKEFHPSEGPYLTRTTEFQRKRIHARSEFRTGDPDLRDIITIFADICSRYQNLAAFSQSRDSCNRLVSRLSLALKYCLLATTPTNYRPKASSHNKNTLPCYSLNSMRSFEFSNKTGHFSSCAAESRLATLSQRVLVLTKCPWNLLIAFF